MPNVPPHVIATGQFSGGFYAVVAPGRGDNDAFGYGATESEAVDALLLALAS